VKEGDAALMLLIGAPWFSVFGALLAWCVRPARKTSDIQGMAAGIRAAGGCGASEAPSATSAPARSGRAE